MKTLILSTLMALPLIGCGGGGGGGSSSSSPAAPVIAPTPTAEVVKTEDLVAPEGFDYNPIETRTLSVDIASLSTARAYLTVYGEYQVAPNGDNVPSYNTKLATLALNNGVGDVELALGEVDSDYLAEIWFYDGTEPMQVVLNSSDTQWNWN